MNEADKMETYHFTDERRRKMSLAHMGKTPWNKGIPATAEHRRKNSEANKGRHLTEDHRRKISDALTGHTTPTETRLKISTSLKGRTNAERANLYRDYERGWGPITRPAFDESSFLPPARRLEAGMNPCNTCLKNFTYPGCTDICGKCEVYKENMKERQR
jgi:hypothetical protein